MITIKRLNSPESIDLASALLYEVYIQQQKWVFRSDNPSQIRIKSTDNKHLLIDRFTERSVWFGAFDNEKIVGCVPLFGADENGLLEIDSYQSAKPVHPFLALQPKDRCYDISKVATHEDYVGQGIVKRLLLACFRFCYEHQFSLFAFTHNGYLKSLFKKIRFPLQMEQAFKYEPQDSSAVNFYFADFANDEVHATLINLEYLESDISNNTKNIFNALKRAESIIPAPFYWMDADGTVLGINELALKAMGATRDIIKKTPYEFYKREIAQHILEHNSEVIRKQEILTQEEWIDDISTKERKCFTSIKAPLYDDEGTIIGIIGTSIEITNEKNQERLKLAAENEASQLKLEKLKLENEINKTLIQEQRRFKKIADQVSHDIRSPLVYLTVLSQTCQEIPESQRIAIRDATTRITDIANNLLSHYDKNADNGTTTTVTQTESEKGEPILVSPVLHEILTEKKYQYQDRAITFEARFDPTANLSWITISPSAFKRTLSNIINNAVDAFDTNNDDQKVIIYLEATDSEIGITIADNGKGMHPELIQKIKNAIAVTEGKANGHGIGLTQVRDTLQNFQGKWEIDSQTDGGTKIKLIFPRIPAQEWVAEVIHIKENDTIVVVDDDSSVHMAWDLRFKDIIKENPRLALKHFISGQEAIDFINSYSAEKKGNLFLLTDYELVNQGITGITIIEQSKISNPILVTSHFANKSVQQIANKIGAKIVPKQFASTIPIVVSKTLHQHAITTADHDVNKVDAILVDDDPVILESFKYLALMKKIDTYQNPQQLLDNIHHYPKNTLILLDQHFNNVNPKGVQIAKELYAKGYTKLFLISGGNLGDITLPDYLPIIMKSDIDTVSAILNEIELVQT